MPRYAASLNVGKQRVETMQVLNILLNRTDTKGWKNHPVTLMWTGYESALQEYQNVVLTEWIKRGYKNNIHYEMINEPIKYPPWFGLEEFHLSHKSNLLRKDFAHYSNYFSDVSDDIPYYWPVASNAS